MSEFEAVAFTQFGGPRDGTCLMCHSPREDGMRFVCHECDAKQLARQPAYDRSHDAEDLAERFRRSGVLWEFARGEKSFATFAAATPGQQKASMLAQQWVDGAPKFLFFHGSPGSGKTHLAQSALTKLIEENQRNRERPRSAHYITARQMQDEIRGMFLEEGEDPVAKLQRLSYLAIDDLGVTASLTRFQADALLSIVDRRVAEKRSTLIIANCDLETLRERLCSPGGSEGGLIVDRMREFVDVAIVADSRRGER